MDLVQLAYGAALLACCVIATWNGEKEERYTVVAVAVASLLSPAVQTAARGQLQIGILLIDILFLGFILHVAYGSKKLWPTIASGIQLAAVMVHLAPALTSSISGKVYGNAGAFWAYLILLTLALGSLAEARK